MNVGHYTNIFALVKLLPTLNENPLVPLHHDLQSALVLSPILPCKKSQHLVTSLEFFQKQKNFLVVGREVVFKFPVFELEDMQNEPSTPWVCHKCLNKIPALKFFICHSAPVWCPRAIHQWCVAGCWFTLALTLECRKQLRLHSCQAYPMHENTTTITLIMSNCKNYVMCVSQ